MATAGAHTIAGAILPSAWLRPGDEILPRTVGSQSRRGEAQFDLWSWGCYGICAMDLGCSGERSALWMCPGVLCLGLVAATGCYRSHGLDDGSNAFDRDSGTDASYDASDLDAGRSVDAPLQCEFTYETPGAIASCAVSVDAEESCRDAARCICSSGVDTPWSFDPMDCVESALVVRALVTFGDYCGRPGPSLGEAVRGFGDFWGADVTTSPECDEIPAVAFYP